jgi:tryptophanyl-tRNA synthetase
MSKSDASSDMALIYMLDDADAIARKIKRATTDPEPLPSEPAGLEGRPEASNLVGIYAALSDSSREQVLAEFGGQGFGAFKPALAELAVTVLSPIAAEMRRLVNDPAEIERILRNGADRARTIAEPHLREVREIIGFVR